MKAMETIVSEMIDAGATTSEAMQAADLFAIMRPGLKIKKNGRIDTAHGDKTPLGLYRMIKANTPTT